MDDARRLFHRWFVEYNPLYLVSAALVLAGTILLSQGVARDESLAAGLGVTAIAELYSAALIGGAALLLRIGWRRSAVMLAVLAAFYQCDLTLHTEICPSFGALGALAAAGWLALFAAKLSALAWAMKLRVSRWATATATVGALGLALFPYVLPWLGPRGAGALVMAWLFALSTLQSMGTVSSAAPLDAWGHTVLRRAVAMTWIMWGLLLGLHLWFWSVQARIDLVALAPVAPLLALRWARTELRAWAIGAATLLLVACAAPASFSATALVASVALCVRAFAHADAARRRLFVGVLFASYLSVWTLRWSEGPWPLHLLPLDVLLTGIGLAGAWKLRARIALLPLTATWAHLVLVQARLVPAPRSLHDWGGVSVGLGFALLFASLGASYRWRR